METSSAFEQLNSHRHHIRHHRRRPRPDPLPAHFHSHRRAFGSNFETLTDELYSSECSSDILTGVERSPCDLLSRLRSNNSIGPKRDAA